MSIEATKFAKEQQNVDINRHIVNAVQGIRFGSVEIIIHEGRVVQIERKEKLRFDNRSALEKNSF